MPQPDAATQTSLFPSTEDVVRHTHKSTDEQAWERERRRHSKRNQAKPNRMLATGPCCGRCQHWTAPVDDAFFGHCRIRVVTTERVPGVVDGGICLGRSHDGRLWRGPGSPLVTRVAVPVEPMRCGPAFSCSAFIAIGEGEVAA